MGINKLFSSLRTIFGVRVSTRGSIGQLLVHHKNTRLVAFDANNMLYTRSALTGNDLNVHLSRQVDRVLRALVSGCDVPSHRLLTAVCSHANQIEKC